MLPPILQTYFLQRRHAGSLPRGPVLPTIEEGKFDILKRAGPREQVEALEDKAKIFTPEQRPLVPIQFFDMDTMKGKAARGWDVQAAKDVHRRRFARTCWAHDVDEIAFLHVHVHALQRLKGGGARSERLGDPAQGYNRHTSHVSAFLVLKLSRDQLHAGLQVLAGHFRLAAVAVSKPDQTGNASCRERGCA